jgi:hypothetical protein
MIKVNKKVNLAQLDQEYNSKGLNGVLDDKGDYVEIGLASNNTGSEEELKECLDKHIAKDLEAERIVQKAALLAKLGITEDEVQLLLGGN